MLPPGYLPIAGPKPAGDAKRHEIRPSVSVPGGEVRTSRGLKSFEILPTSRRDFRFQGDPLFDVNSDLNRRAQKRGDCGCSGCGDCGGVSYRPAFSGTIGLRGPSSKLRSWYVGSPSVHPNLPDFDLVPLSGGSSKKPVANQLFPPYVSANPNCEWLSEHGKWLEVMLEDAHRKCRDLYRQSERLHTEQREDSGNPCEYISQRSTELTTTEGTRNPPPSGYSDRLSYLNHLYRVCVRDEGTYEEMLAARQTGYQLQIEAITQQIYACDRWEGLISAIYHSVWERLLSMGCPGWGP